MTKLQEIVKRYTIRYDKKIKSVTVPLNHYLNISSYTYYRIEDNGRFITLSNNPDQLDFYYHEKFYLHNPYLVDPNLLRSGFVLTATTKDEKYLDTVHTSFRRFQLDNTFLILEKKIGYVEGFFFGTEPNTNQASTIYLNNYDLLKKFNRFFVREMEPLLGKMHADQFNLKIEKGKQFSERNAELPLASKDEVFHHFLKSISPLSPQEERCLELFRLGHSAQATASIMGLSRRTVEHYFENIKNKLGCHSKWDLLQIG